MDQRNVIQDDVDKTLRELFERWWTQQPSYRHTEKESVWRGFKAGNKMKEIYGLD